MASTLADVRLLLFVPADRPERYAKALGAGADAVVVDLEDAVDAAGKPAARAALLADHSVLAASRVPVILRINAIGTPSHEADLAVAAALPFAAVMLAKAEDAAGVHATAHRSAHPVLALVESAAGLFAAREIAGAAARLAFGSIDYAADLGCAHSREALLFARAQLVLASRLAKIAPPIDGVSTGFREPSVVEEDARHAAGLGFGGKLLIHPAQIAPARAGFKPSAGEIAWAERVLGSVGDGAVALDGVMIDAPVRVRAEQIVERANAANIA